MKLFRQIFTPSIRRTISFAFLVVTVFVLVMAVASYIQLRQVKPYSDAIIQNSFDQVQLQKLAAATSALDADLERYLVIRGVEYQESVQTDLQEIAEAFAVLQSSSTADVQSELTTLEETITQLQLGVQQVLDAQASDASSGETTLRIVTVYDHIDRVKQLQEALSAKTLSVSQATAQTQSQIAGNVLTQFVILGTVVLVIAVFTAWTTDRRLRTITTLTSAATEIAAGDLSRVAAVESDDEIGTLAEAFNAMTSQLRELIGTLEQRVADRTKALATSAEVSRRLSTLFNQEELVREVVEQVQSAFGYYHAHIYLAEGDELVMAGGTGEAGAEMLASGHKIPKGRGLVGRAAESNETVLVADTSQDPNWLPNELLPETRAEAAIPISVGNRVLGVLDVQHNVTEGLGEEDMDSLQSIANQVAVALQNARAFTQAEQQRRQNELILGAAGEGIFGVDVEGNHTFVNPAAAEMLGYSIEELIGNHSHSMWHHTHVDGTPFPKEECPIYFTLKDGIVHQGEEYFIRKDGTGFDVSFSSRPILEEDRLVGAVVTFADITQQKHEREATALRARQQEALNLISQKIQSAATIEEAMQVTARELGHALGNRQTFVALDPAVLAGDGGKKVVNE